MKGFVLVNARAGEVQEVVRNLRRLKGVVTANATFGPYDAVAVVESQSVRSLGDLVTAQIQPLPGVEETLTCLAVDEG